MFFTIKELLKEKKQQEELEKIENINLKNNEKIEDNKDLKTTESPDNKDNENNDNNDNKEIEKKSKTNIKKTKKNPSKKTENPLNKFLKNNKENGKTSYQKEKDKKKELKKEKKKQRRKLLYNKNAYPLYYQLILQVLVFVVILNICINTFSSGYKMTGTMSYENGKYIFTPNFSELYLNNYEDFRDLDKGDKIYVYYDKKSETFKYSLKEKWFKMNLEGTIYKATDYYLYIDFDFNNEINSNSYYLEKHSAGEEFTVVIKKFLFDYIIDEPLTDSIIDKITSTLMEHKE